MKHHQKLVFLREQNMMLSAINCSADWFKANLSDGQIFVIIVPSAGTELSPGHLVTSNYIKACGGDSCHPQRNGKVTVAELILFTQPLCTLTDLRRKLSFSCCGCRESFILPRHLADDITFKLWSKKQISLARENPLLDSAICVAVLWLKTF